MAPAGWRRTNSRRRRGNCLDKERRRLCNVDRSKRSKEEDAANQSRPSVRRPPLTFLAPANGTSPRARHKGMEVRTPATGHTPRHSGTPAGPGIGINGILDRKLQREPKFIVLCSFQRPARKKKRLQKVLLIQRTLDARMPDEREPKSKVSWHGGVPRSPHSSPCAPQSRFVVQRAMRCGTLQ